MVVIDTYFILQILYIFIALQLQEPASSLFPPHILHVFCTLAGVPKYRKYDNNAKDEQEVH